jgi:hypothetical protein
MNPLDSTRMMFQPWNEDAFQSDLQVRYMTPLQRWMYRTLLQSAFTCSERPYLPDNNAMLWMLAGCETQAQWLDSAAPVRAMFTQVKSDNGTPLLSRKRLVEDWTRCQKRLADKIEQRVAAGRKSAEKCQRGPDGTFISKSEAVQNEQNANEYPTQPNDNPTNTQRSPANATQPNATQPNPTYPPLDGSSESAGGRAGSPSETRANGAGKIKTAGLNIEDLQSAWTEYRMENGEDCISVGLPKSGYPKLISILKENHLETNVQEVKAAFVKWIEDRYFPAIDTGNAIVSPVSVFADDVVNYIHAMYGAKS